MESKNCQSVDLQNIINELEALKRAVYKKKSRCTITTLERKINVILNHLGYGTEDTSIFPEDQNELAHGGELLRVKYSKTKRPLRGPF